MPALATGGTGDVLAGVIAGFIAQGSEPYEAAVTAVYVHAEAGRRVASRLGDSGLLASDLLSELPLVMHALRQGSGQGGVGDPGLPGRQPRGGIPPSGQGGL